MQQFAKKDRRKYKRQACNGHLLEDEEKQVRVCHKDIQRSWLLEAKMEIILKGSIAEIGPKKESCQEQVCRKKILGIISDSIGGFE